MNDRYLLIYFSNYKYSKIKRKYIYTFPTLENAIYHLSKSKHYTDERVIIIDLLKHDTLLDVEY